MYEVEVFFRDGGRKFFHSGSYIPHPMLGSDVWSVVAEDGRVMHFVLSSVNYIVISPVEKADDE